MSNSLKVCLIGEDRSGKSCWINKHFGRDFHNYEVTIGAKFITTNVYFDRSFVKLNIWDSAGQHRYFSLLPLYFRGAHIIFIFVDLSKEVNEDHVIIRYLESIQNKVNILENGIKSSIVIIGNKLDIAKEGMSLKVKGIAEKYHLKYIEMSVIDDNYFCSIATAVLFAVDPLELCFENKKLPNETVSPSNNTTDSSKQKCVIS